MIKSVSPQESYLCQFSTNLEMVNCELGPTFEAEFQHVWKMSWCEVTKFGPECHQRCFLEISKSWNVNIHTVRKRESIQFQWCYICLDMWNIEGDMTIYGKLPEMESLCTGHSRKDSWHCLNHHMSAIFLTGSTLILKGGVFWKFCLSSMWGIT